MAFIVEDGTGLPNSTSYAEVSFADAYFLDRMILTWSNLTEDEKKANLIRATDYINARWGHLFKGDSISETQALVFPTSAFEGIPEILKKATSEYALRASFAPLAPDIEQDPSGFQVSRKFEKVGPIEERTDFAFLGPGATRQLLKPYPAADMLLRQLLRNAQGRVIRN